MTSSPTDPIILLKTESRPADNYAAFFQSRAQTPIFIPVLAHNYDLAPLLSALSPAGSFPHTHHGLIFTSQRAVEGLDAALAQLSTASSASSSTPDAPRPRPQPQHAGQLLDDYYRTHGVLPPLYTVGPATSVALQRVANRYFAVNTRNTLLGGAEYPVRGKDTGNGEKLAEFILEDYEPPPRSGSTSDAENGERRGLRAPLLFFVGEQRRDIIPKTLMSEELPAERRVKVDEEVVYETAVCEEFEGGFGKVLEELREAEKVWVVVFSPAGCQAMLSVLGWTREAGWPEGIISGGRRKLFVATIGPTTRDHLSNEFGFQADVCAPKPSPEGIAAGIDSYERSHPPVKDLSLSG